MTLILSIIAFIVIFSLLILIHEFGHFFVAKKCGIKVEEFGLGMPPKVWSFKPKNSETIYTLNAIPFGGFVRLYGEDSQDNKALKSSKSYVAKPAWMKILVVVAGVAMNFILAFVLLSIGYLIGMQPLLVTSEDIFSGINDGSIKLEQGIVVKEVNNLNSGVMAGDKIISINGKKIVLGNELSNLKDQQEVNLELERSGKLMELKYLNVLKQPVFKNYDPILLPRVVINNLEANSRAFSNGLRSGDIISKINDQQIFDFKNFETKWISGEVLQLEIMRNNQIINLNIPAQENLAHLVISGVENDSPAAKADLRVGDEVMAVDSQIISSTKDLSKVILTDKAKDQFVYKIKRQGQLMDLYISKNSAGLIGALLSDLHSQDSDKFSYYLNSIPYSILEIKNVSYPWYQVPGKAMSEMGRLSLLTAQMFGNVFAQIFTKFSVPDGVAGPVGIAQMTYVFVQEGIMSLIRFTALLSLSLAIINILPFPGLDGGRFFLIIVPLLIGKKLNPKLEGIIHLMGFLVLMLLILLITFNDIAKFFT